MIIDPKQVLDEKIVLAEIDEKQVQMVGIDMRARKLMQIGDDRNLLLHQDQILLSPQAAYEIVVDRVKMPENRWGYIIGRSSFNRAGILIRSSVIDPGYEGDMGVTAYCFGQRLLMRGERVGQLLVFPAKPSKIYNGQYQGEKK